jgi:hypothetical protein
MHRAPAHGRAWLVATTLDLDDRSLKVHRPRPLLFKFAGLDVISEKKIYDPTMKFTHY